MDFNESCSGYDSVVNKVLQFRGATLTWRYCTPVIIALGTIGNSISLVVLQRAKMRRNVLAKQLTALAASNILILYFTMLVKYLLYFKKDSFLGNQVACKLIHWLSEPLAQFNSWLMVAITCERFVAVMKPLQMRTAGRAVNAKRQIFLIAALFLFLNSHALYGYGPEYRSEERCGNATLLVDKCGLVNSIYREFYSYWIVVQIVLMFYLPALLLFIGNIGIVLMLKKRSNRTMFKRGKSLASDRLGLRAIHTLAMVLLLNTAFILSSAPICVVFFVYAPWDRQNRRISNFDYTMRYTVANMVMYTNYSTGFLFFTVISDFRSELCRLVKLGKRGYLFNQRMSVYSLEQVSIDSKSC